MQIEIIGGTPAIQAAVKNKLVGGGVRADTIKTEMAHTAGNWRAAALVTEGLGSVATGNRRRRVGARDWNLDRA